MSSPSKKRDRDKDRQTTPSPGKAKPWLPSEDLTLLRELLQAGERTMDWHAALAHVNKKSRKETGSSYDRSMASIRGHWQQSLRPRLELLLNPDAEDIKYGSPRRKRSKGEQTKT